MILLKVISIFVLLFIPLHESSDLVDLIIDIYFAYPTFFLFINIPFPILYIYWGIKRKIEKGFAFYGAFFSILQIPLMKSFCIGGSRVAMLNRADDSGKAEARCEQIVNAINSRDRAAIMAVFFYFALKKQMKILRR